MYVDFAKCEKQKIEGERGREVCVRVMRVCIKSHEGEFREELLKLEMLCVIGV